MTLLIYFAIIFSTIELSIVLQRIIHCPILVGFAFFSIFLVIAVIFASTTLVIIAIILGIISFISAFLDCIIRRSGFFRNNSCLNCEDTCCNCNRDNNSNNNNCTNNDDETLTIVNSNGVVLARINGDTIRCRENNDDDNNGCGCNNENNTLQLGCGRNNRYRR